MPKVAELFGNICSKIGIVIALAALIGQCMMESGAADKIVRVFVRMLGEKRAAWSLLSSGYVLSIPVFFDTVFYLLIPLARAMRIRTKKNYVLFVMAISCGAVVTHSLVPPTPGPLAMAATLNIDLGVMILVGFLIGIPMALVGYAFCIYRNRTLDIPFRETSGMSVADLEELASKEESHLPGFLHSMAPILIPVLFITSNTIVNAIGPSSSIAKYTAFIGDANFALLAATAIALHLLAKHRKYSLAELAKPVERAFASGGLIILITAGGGAFGGMLVQAGVGDVLGEMSRDYSVPLLILCFMLASLIKIAQGSGTVSMITTASIIGPMIIAAPPSFHPVYVACAIGSGSLVSSWMNDSGFWIIKQMAGFTEVETLKTWTSLLTILGFTGIVVTLIVSALLPL